MIGKECSRGERRLFQQYPSSCWMGVGLLVKFVCICSWWDCTSIDRRFDDYKVWPIVMTFIAVILDGVIDLSSGKYRGTVTKNSDWFARIFYQVQL